METKDGGVEEIPLCFDFLPNQNAIKVAIIEHRSTPNSLWDQSIAFPKDENPSLLWEHFRFCVIIISLTHGIYYFVCIIGYFIFNIQI